MEIFNPNKVHFTSRINSEHGNGWSDCGRLIEEGKSYNESIPGRDKITCLKCRVVSRRISR